MAIKTAKVKKAKPFERAERAKSRPTAENVALRIRTLLAEQAGLPVAEIVRCTRLKDDGLGFDSFDCLEIIMDLEDDFNVSVQDEEMEKWVTAGDAIDFLEERLAKARIL
jgi:acyl carrier protein